VGAFPDLACAWLTQRSPARRVAAWVLALAGPALVTLALIPFRSSLSVGGFLFCMLLVVIAVAVAAGARPALTAVAAGAVAGAFIYDSPAAVLGADLVSLVVFVVVGAAVGILIGRLAQLAEEASSRQVEATLRRVATFVAGAAPPDELFAAVAEEAGQLLGADFAHMAHYGSDAPVTFVRTWSRTGDHFPIGSQWSLAGENLSTAVLRAGRPARIDGFADAFGPIATASRQMLVRSAAGAPIIVDGRIWGMMVTGSRLKRPLPPDTEARLASFTDLVATAISNAESRSDLDASRARIVAASDEARRRIERDLHDDVQQRLVSLGLALRAAQAAVPPQLGELEGQLANVADGLARALDDLRETDPGQLQSSFRGGQGVGGVRHRRRFLRLGK